MAHYAELNENNEVIYVIYMDNEIITDENGVEQDILGLHHLHKHHGSDKRWVRTSYNGNFRGTYASVGSFYDEEKDIFIPPRPFYGPTWVFNEETLMWEPPIPMPQEDGFWFEWNEELQLWEKRPNPDPPPFELIVEINEETGETTVRYANEESNP